VNSQRWLRTGPAQANAAARGGDAVADEELDPVDRNVVCDAGLDDDPFFVSEDGLIWYGEEDFGRWRGVVNCNRYTDFIKAAIFFDDCEEEGEQAIQVADIPGAEDIIALFFGGLFDDCL
jgi:hypothetical protein